MKYIKYYETYEDAVNAIDILSPALIVLKVSDTDMRIVHKDLSNKDKNMYLLGDSMDSLTFSSDDPVLTITVNDSADTEVIQLTLTKNDTVIGDIIWTCNLDSDYIKIEGTNLVFLKHYEGDITLTASADNISTSKTISVSCNETIVSTTYEIVNIDSIDDIYANTTSVTLNYTIKPIYHYQLKTTEGDSINCSAELTFNKNTELEDITYTGGYADNEHNIQVNWTVVQYSNNKIFYTAPSKLIESDNISSNTLYTAGFNTTIKSHEFSNGKGIITFDDFVTSINDYAFNNCLGLTSITIPSTVTSISDNAFYKLLTFVEVEVDDDNTNFTDGDTDCIIENTSKKLILGSNNTTIPSDTISINNYAFYDCDTLTSVNIPSTVTSIGDLSFTNCYDLTSISVDSENTIYNDASNSNCIVETTSNTVILTCNNTTSQTIGSTDNTTTFIGATSYFYRLTDSLQTAHITFTNYSSCTDNWNNWILILSNSVKDSDGYAEYLTLRNDNYGWNSLFDSTKLSSDFIWDTFKSDMNGSTVSMYINYDISKKIVKITSTITTSAGKLYNYNFTSSANSSLPDILYFYFSVDNSHIKDFKVEYIYNDVYDLSFYINTTSINKSISLMYNTSITDISNNIYVDNVNNSDKSITYNFSKIGLHNIRCTFVNPLTSIPSYAFSGISLASINIPTSVTFIDEKSFQGCTGLTSINIPDSVTSISYAAFFNSSLTTITIGSGIKSIGQYAFGIASLITVICNATTPPTIDTGTFYHCTNLTAIYVPSESVELYKAATNWSSLASKISAIS